MKPITVEVVVKKDITTVWDAWNKPEHIQKWAFASTDWECPYAENDLRVGGKFVTRMAAKDKSTSFDFNGVYDEVVPQKWIAYIIEGGRKVTVLFEEVSGGVKIVETFDPENENPEEMQKGGWQAILESFRGYVEGRKN
jgi:uncharacterized protein YndB with AHSA1/START domain